MTDVPITQGFAYLTSIVPTGTPLTISGANIGSGGNTVRIVAKASDEDLQAEIPVNLQVPQTNFETAANTIRLRFMKKCNKSFTVTGLIKNETIGADSTTRENYRDILENYVQEGNSGKVLYLVIPKVLTPSAETATSVYQYPSGTNGLKGLILKLKITENDTSKLNDRFEVILTFQVGVDF